MTQEENKNYELNKEALVNLTVADLTGIITLQKLYPFMSESAQRVFIDELGLRLKNIIIE